MANKTPEEIAADEAEQRRQREELAKEANKKRNEARLERLNAIADNSDAADPEKKDLEDMTDEKWEEEDAQDKDEPPPKKKKPEAKRVAKEEDEDATLEESEEDRAVRRRAEREDREIDEAREAGAEDSRKREDGTVEYKLVVNGKVKWLTLGQLREQAGDVAAAEELHGEEERGRTTTVRAPSPTPEEIRAAAEQAKQARKAKLKDLHTRASMGDEEAIDELAEIQAGLSEVTPDGLRELVTQTVDARVAGKSAFDKAVDWFEDEYERELSSPRLKKMAARLDREFATANPDLGPRERLKKVGEELRATRRELVGDSADDAPRRNDKLNRKRNLPHIPEAAGRERAEPEPDEAGSTTSVIEQMARGRGQARAIKH